MKERVRKFKIAGISAGDILLWDGLVPLSWIYRKQRQKNSEPEYREIIAVISCHIHASTITFWWVSSSDSLVRECEMKLADFCLRKQQGEIVSLISGES